MTVGLLDLSIVTDQLLAQLRDARRDTRLWDEELTPPLTGTPPPGTPIAGDPGVNALDATPQDAFAIIFTGAPPDAARAIHGNCKISLYLFHVAQDNYYRNTFPADPTLTAKADIKAEGRPRRPPQQPLALRLYYLLSAHSESYIEEQQAMSIALKCFHDHAIVTATVPAHARGHEMTVTMEPQTIEEIGRLWQSITTPMRLCAVYRASVVFIEPDTPKKSDLKPVEHVTVSAYPEFAVVRADASATGFVTVWGAGFHAASIEVRLDGVLLAITAARPTVGQVRVVETTKLELQLPSGTRAGIVRLGVKLTSHDLEAVFTIKVGSDVP